MMVATSLTKHLMRITATMTLGALVMIAFGCSRQSPTPIRATPVLSHESVIGVWRGSEWIVWIDFNEDNSCEIYSYVTQIATENSKCRWEIKNDALFLYSTDNVVKDFAGQSFRMENDGRLSGKVSWSAPVQKDPIVYLKRDTQQ